MFTSVHESFQQVSVRFFEARGLGAGKGYKAGPVRF